MTPYQWDRLTECAALAFLIAALAGIALAFLFL